MFTHQAARTGCSGKHASLCKRGVQGGCKLAASTFTTAMLYVESLNSSVCIKRLLCFTAASLQVDAKCCRQVPAHQCNCTSVTHLHRYKLNVVARPRRQKPRQVPEHPRCRTMQGA